MLNGADKQWIAGCIIARRVSVIYAEQRSCEGWLDLKTGHVHSQDQDGQQVYASSQNWTSFYFHGFPYRWMNQCLNDMHGQRVTMLA